MRRSDANKNTSHDLNETLFAPRERTQIDPDVLSGKPLPWAEPWAGKLAGFRETILAHRLGSKRWARAYCSVPAGAGASVGPPNSFIMRVPSLRVRWTVMRANNSNLGAAAVWIGCSFRRSGRLTLSRLA
jgi:hypothetical protein